MLEGFKIVGKIEQIEIIAVGSSIRILPYLNKQFGKGRRRKLKGVATVERISNGRVRLAEIHWYEAHGIGKKDLKIKFPFLD
jgi:hypothetical protein